VRAAAGYFTSLRLEIPFEIVSPRLAFWPVPPPVPRPSPQGIPCVLDTFFHLEGLGLYTQLGPHDTIHFGEVH